MNILLGMITDKSKITRENRFILVQKNNKQSANFNDGQILLHVLSDRLEVYVKISWENWRQY